ncbi:hypothetical protein PENFLA_c016G06454 [Penicillium flavigenum]|uniref:Beta-hexosaminidase n=1 Tax=Penicillium flavigenum TaxID=254877 RepID=A0A1V6T344_9EURO|nr:hypothetical protein PENFLA_c016G06454 [Penicillium flavigenum]
MESIPDSDSGALNAHSSLDDASNEMSFSPRKSRISSPLSPILFAFFNSDLIDQEVTIHGGASAFIDDYFRWQVANNDVQPQLPQSKAVTKSISSLEVVTAAVQRARESIFKSSIVPWKFHPRNELDRFEPQLAIQRRAVDETYNLTIGTNGAAAISAVSTTGVLCALETFTQLFYSHSVNGTGVYSNLAPVSISDWPQFSHRGLVLDVSRNWYPKEHILRTIDALSWNKFNRAYQTGLSYTPQDIEYIQIYGIYRGIEVIVEIDIPGHTTSIGFAYPELITAFRQQPWHDYCSEPPCGQLKLNSTPVYDVTKLFDDVLPRLSPYSAYFHTGGDEIESSDYLLDHTVNSKDIAVIAPLLQNFIDHSHDFIRKASLVPITWDGNSTLGKVTAQGHKALFGDTDSWYLACGHGKWFNFEDVDIPANYPYADFCSPINNWRVVWEYDPIASLPAEQAALVIGGEIHLFSEQSDPSNLDTMVWPRSSAGGENMWSGRQTPSGQNRSQADAAARLSDLRERMVLRGINLAPVQMAWCTQYGGDCTW